MKKLTGTFVVIVAILLTAPAAHATTFWCVTFDNFCDGMEILKRPDQLTGTWVNTDCAGTDVPFTGVGLNGPGQLRAFCTDASCPAGLDFLFQMDGPNRLFNLFGFDGANVIVFQVNQPFTITDGICAFEGDVRGGVPSSLR